MQLIFSWEFSVFQLVQKSLQFKETRNIQRISKEPENDTVMYHTNRITLTCRDFMHI
jgi:hypothetical protein